MTVRELINKLEKLNQDAVVHMYGGETDGLTKVVWVEQENDGTRVWLDRD